MDVEKKGTTAGTIANKGIDHCQRFTGRLKGMEMNKVDKGDIFYLHRVHNGVFVTVAVPLHPETAVSVAWFFEASYYNVANATYFEPLLGDIETSSARRRRSAIETKNILTRRHFYTIIESMLEKPSASLQEDIEDCYYEAEYWGLENKCDYLTDMCPTSPLDFISVVFED
ncbi:unnamed protein product [Leptidea sinapis]|uniref:Uncharacterized protein n=1 Tax=Leptidea sinapis TaxID=189913 RepID=A0A5E4QIP5_9NEOP|nr:unnamed protein product [Leptidea sinapis]